MKKTTMKPKGSRPPTLEEQREYDAMDHIRRLLDRALIVGAAHFIRGLIPTVREDPQNTTAFLRAAETMMVWYAGPENMAGLARSCARELKRQRRQSARSQKKKGKSA
jgi:hypothetical protein